MKKILFTHSYFLRFDPKQWSIGQPYAPLATLFAASFMRGNDYRVSLFDTMFAHGPADIKGALEQQPDFFVIYDDGFNYLTKMCLTNMRHAAFEMIGMAKMQNCPVIVSSSDATDHYDQYLQAGADFVVIGEAEHTLLQLTEAINSGASDFMNIKGLAYKSGNSIIKTARRNVIKDLDCLPLPAWDLINIEPYRDMWMKHAGFFSINIGTTRGCPFKCNWCAKPIYGNRYNARSPQNVVSELKLLKDKFNFDHVWFCDDIFGLKPGWVSEFAELVQRENLQFKFKIQSRADLLVQDKYVEALAKTGCDNVWMGAESGSQKILDAMDKGITIQQVKDATYLLKQHHIKPSFFIQFGYLGETREDIELTIKMINKLMPYEIGISVSYPLPGTGFYEKVKEQLKEKANWTDSDELALMFCNTYQPAFYKKLHHYVHRNYRKHLAFENLKNIFKRHHKINLSVVKKALSVFYYTPAVYVEKLRLKQFER